jgi:cytochrome c-type biogenesis protein CcsB
MLRAEVLLFWLTVFAYVTAFCAHIFPFVRGKPPRAIVQRALWMGLLFHTATIVVRWIAGGHPPVTDTYELNLIGSWFTMLVFLLFAMGRKIDQTIGLIVTPITFLVLGHGFMSRTEALPMSPAYHSPWLIVHVVFAWIAFGCFAVAAGAAGMLLLRDRLADGGRRRIPSVEALDMASYRFIVLGFINHAVMLASGAIWAKKLWGHYWSWDALETWSLITFIFYALYLHMRAFLGWKLRRAAWLAAFGLIVLSISFWGVEFFSASVHPGP